MGSFNLGDGPAGKDVTDLVRMLAEIRRHEGALEIIREATTSCKQWGGALQQLMSDPKVFNKAMLRNAEQFLNKLKGELRGGRSVLVQLKLPAGRGGCGEHIFCIEARSDGRHARVLHAWQGKHQLRAERNMPIDELVEYLKELPSLDWTVPQQKGRVGEICGKIWGQGHDEVPHIAEYASRKRVSFEMIISGEVEVPLTDPRSSRQLSAVLNEASDWMSARSRSSTSFHSAIESEEVNPVRGKISIRMGGAIGGALGFVFGVGGALYAGKRNPGELALEGLKPGLAGAAGGAAGAAAAKALTPTFGRIGVSVVRANAVAGIAFSAVFAIWDVASWKMHKITKVAMRKRMAENLGGASGGIAGGAGAGVAGGLVFGPVGAVAGGIIGGIAGGIAGLFAGKAIDNAIWDESEDAVMNSYEFFGWHDVGRSTRPVKTPEEMGQAYDKKLEEKPKKMKVEDWSTICLATLMTLLPAMYPEITELMKMGDDLQKNKGAGVSAVAKLMYQSVETE